MIGRLPSFLGPDLFSGVGRLLLVSGVRVYLIELGLLENLGFAISVTTVKLGDPNKKTPEMPWSKLNEGIPKKGSAGMSIVLSK